MNAPHHLSARRALTAIDILAHYGCYFSPAQRARVDCALLHTEDKNSV